ncbi:hypothetical protein BC937DRAFT_94256 [Endogone sp. FLAS-F59071]|nr:hypothetical protein BC937DRAFT_94256 [Endogone sp. FLAS-F59071]|eukprot:RUS14164.1 hypothetical protein BC937DRAFT_94256 [Endogone sp. FLAS-F59071]
MHYINSALLAFFATITTTSAFGTQCLSASRQFPKLDLPTAGGAQHVFRPAPHVFRPAPYVFPNLRPRQVSEDSEELEYEATPPNLKVAFLGDQGIGANPRAVLEMIRDWGGQGIIHAGDLDYQFSPLQWLRLIDGVLGPVFPYFVTIGNHDLFNWHDRFGYRHIIEDRLFRTEMENNCHGEYGVNMACTWKGLTIILSGVGTMGTGHEDFIAGGLSQSKAIWKVCSWHKLQHKYQPGHKNDEVGYGVYEMCRRHGAFIHTAHEHSWARTHLMSNFEFNVINSTAFTLDVRPGNTFLFVSGLGGVEVRPGNPERAKDPWWAQIATDDEGVTFGALLCEFHVDGNPNHAMCMFKDISGVVWDRFNITSTPGPRSKTFENEDEIPSMTKWFEYPITNPRDMLVSSSALTVATASTINFPLAHSTPTSATTLLRFRNLRLPPTHGLLNAHLQIMLAERPEAESDKAVRVRLTISRPATGRKIEVEELLEHFEPSEVWVSPDIADLFDYDETELDIVEIEVAGMIEGEVDTVDVLEGYAWGEEGCLAPTLVWQSAEKSFL